MEKEVLKNQVIAYFKEFIFDNHIKASIETHTKLKSYKINPIVVQYLSKLLENDYSPAGVAKALYYPRVLGTSINTSFGTRIQDMFIVLGLANGSMIKGMDIEFVDKIDGRKKWCQLKSGPNTINSEDVNPLLRKFTNTINLARTNKALAGINNTDFIVGVLYGESNELSQHYLRIDKTHPVYIGEDFWLRVTGFENFYSELITSLGDSIAMLNTQNLLDVGVQTLAEEVASSPLFNFPEE